MGTFLITEFIAIYIYIDINYLIFIIGS